jgi:hypothetical protein
MIQVPIADLWVMLGLWLAVVICGYLFGWHAGRYWRHGPDEVDQAIRRHPSTVNRLDHVPPRPGRLDLEDDPTSIDIARHWTALERNAGPVTTPLSHVEVSNWERKIERDNRAWMHKHGIPGELWGDPRPATATRHAR